MVKRGAPWEHRKEWHCGEKERKATEICREERSGEERRGEERRGGERSCRLEHPDEGRKLGETTNGACQHDCWICDRTNTQS